MIKTGGHHLSVFSYFINDLSQPCSANYIQLYVHDTFISAVHKLPKLQDSLQAASIAPADAARCCFALDVNS